jgi:transposase InsO family protein
MMDITAIPGLFRIVIFKLVLAIDVFSRMPLAGKVTLKEPSAQVCVEVFQKAVEQHGTTPHLVTDQGPQFTAAVFMDVVKAAGTKQRFGAVRMVGSIARIERLWRTFKGIGGVGQHPPLTLSDCQKRVELALLYYAYLRPHRSLGGATPAEVHFGIKPAHESAVHPPRGRRGEEAGEAPFEVVYLEEDRRLPFLLERAA